MPLQSQVLMTLSELILSTPKLTQTEGGEIIRFGLSISGSGAFPSGYLAALTSLFKLWDHFIFEDFENELRQNLLVFFLN